MLYEKLDLPAKPAVSYPADDADRTRVGIQLSPRPPKESDEAPSPQVSPLDTLNIVAGVASILGLSVSFVALFQARRASVAAAAARDAIMIRTLADELGLVCIRAEQLVDFLVHERFDEAALRVAELVSELSEMPRRRSPYLDEGERNSLLTSREHLHSIGGVIQEHRTNPVDPPGRNRLISVAGRVVASLREVSGTVKSQLAAGGTK